MLLTVNTGSSSLRLAAFALEGESLARRASVHFPDVRGDPIEILRAFLNNHGIEETADVAGDAGVEMARRAGEVRVNAA